MTQKFGVLAAFTGLNGGNPSGDLFADSNGDLFGTTQLGGANNAGTVFEIVNAPTGYATSPTTLITFNTTNGAFPDAGLIADANGNLYGTTNSGGASGGGTVFEIARTATGYASTPTTLVSFNGTTNGGTPVGSLLLDSQGNLLGTASTGGANGSGTVFEILNTATGYASTPTTLINFTLLPTGGTPGGALIADAGGNLFGTTETGGPDSLGTVFEIANTSTGYATAVSTLAAFPTGAFDSGFQLFGSLILDAGGNLFGTTSQGGGDPSSGGTVFEVPKLSTGYTTGFRTVASFNNGTGVDPAGSLIMDAQGNLFGTTRAGGGPGHQGTVFEIVNTATGYASTPTVIFAFDTGSFTSTTGNDPRASLLANANGDLFGTAFSGGPANDGVVFGITGSPFAAACFALGTRLLTSRGDIPVETLRVGETMITAPDGDEAPIVWIGKRTIDCARHPRPARVWPIRVAASAFGPGRPCNDLFLSPDHAIYVGDVLVPVKYLLNDTTITQTPVDRVDYYHVELPSHDLVFAEALPVESYLDVGDRGNFSNSPGPVRLFPEFQPFLREARGRAPLIVTGPRLAAARAAVARAAKAAEPSLMEKEPIALSNDCGHAGLVREYGLCGWEEQKRSIRSSTPR